VETAKLKYTVLSLGLVPFFLNRQCEVEMKTYLPKAVMLSGISFVACQSGRFDDGESVLITKNGSMYCALRRMIPMLLVSSAYRSFSAVSVRIIEASITTRIKLYFTGGVEGFSDLLLDFRIEDEFFLEDDFFFVWIPTAGVLGAEESSEIIWFKFGSAVSDVERDCPASLVEPCLATKVGSASGTISKTGTRSISSVCSLLTFVDVEAFAISASSGFVLCMVLGGRIGDGSGGYGAGGISPVGVNSGAKGGTGVGEVRAFAFVSRAFCCVEEEGAVDGVSAFVIASLEMSDNLGGSFGGRTGGAVAIPSVGDARAFVIASREVSDNLGGDGLDRSMGGSAFLRLRLGGGVSLDRRVEGESVSA